MTRPTHLTAREIVERLPLEQKRSRRGVLARAGKEKWPWIVRPGMGGEERAFEIASLPSDVHGAIAASLSHPTAANDVRRGRGRPTGSDHFARHPDQAQAILSWISRHKHSVPSVMELLVAEFDDLPGEKTLQRYMRRVEGELGAVLLRHRNPDKAKGRNQLAIGRADASVTHAHEVWELDTTKADVMTLGGRRMILGVIDRFSRRIRFLVAPSESGQSVRRILIDTMTAWNVTPEAVATDNGSGYINASIVTALDFLGIRHIRCAPGTPEHKPFVERMFGTFTRSRAVLFDGFTGHNVADATAIRSRNKKEQGRAIIAASMTPEDLQHRLDAWVDGSYHLKRHSGIGMTPLDKLMTSPVPAARAPEPEHLRIALSALVGPRRIGKKGLVWQSHSYWCPELAAWIGKQVLVRRDEEDIGALLVFDEDNHFIGTAINHERSGISQREFAMRARADQKSEDRRTDVIVRAARRTFPITRARDKVFLAEDERAGKIAILARPTLVRTTPQLDSLAPPMLAPLPDDRAIARAESRPIERHRAPDAMSIRQKVRRTDALIAAHAAGQDVDPAALRSARAYAKSGEYRVDKMLAEDFQTEEKQ